MNIFIFSQGRSPSLLLITFFIQIGWKKITAKCLVYILIRYSPFSPNTLGSKFQNEVWKAVNVVIWKLHKKSQVLIFCRNLNIVHTASILYLVRFIY